MELLGKEFKGPFDLDSEELPDSLGVYILVNGSSQDFKPLYVGKAQKIRQRVSIHRSSSRFTSNIKDHKIDKVYFCQFESDSEAFEFEMLLHKKYLPELNRRTDFNRINTEFLQTMKEIERSSAKRSAYSLSVFALLATILSFVLSAYISNEKYTQKDKLQESIIVAVNNGADLRAVKHIFLNREIVQKSFFQVFKDDTSLYSYNVPLSYVLEDIRTGMFLAGSESNQREAINKLIEEHTHLNPFDRLEPIQRDYFENIKIILKDDYQKIYREVNKVADELHTKNLLVDEYLKDSNTSFWISVIALIFSIAVSSYQIFNSRGSRMQRLFAESFSQIITKDGSKDT